MGVPSVIVQQTSFASQHPPKHTLSSGSQQAEYLKSAEYEHWEPLRQQRPSPALGQHCELSKGQQPQSVQTSTGSQFSQGFAVLQHCEYSPAEQNSWPAGHWLETFFFRFFRLFALCLWSLWLP